MRDKYAPKYKPGDLLVERPKVKTFMGLSVVLASDVVVYRVIAVHPDKDAADREDEPGYGHVYECEYVGETKETRKIRGRSTCRVMQGHACRWSSRRKAVLKAFRERLKELEALP